ncbi:membrane protein UL45 [Macacine alphaherpesvirus 3]|uniref:Envelope protein UL45 n=1 Tax=Macacine alphaherpesvirus 3 TaxID=2845555 RepID=A0A1X9WF86_9ALPH|nr:membrane protein UL45 [Macacine alphaherpesvirus 1]ARS01757.1 membrane protein UL45 [Macacine alphaherpesvirus 1]ARS01832.1 membrane protein UL45 [Macacine alphaherpesvirus 3]
MGPERLGYRPLVSGGRPAPSGRLPAALWLLAGVAAGSVVVLAGLVLAVPRAAWGLAPCGTGWLEFNAGCLAWDPTPVDHELAAGGCRAPATLIPRAAAKQLAAVAGVGARASGAYWWVDGDGIRACLRPSDGATGIDQFCEGPALRICYHPRAPGGFVRFVLSVRDALGLP